MITNPDTISENKSPVLDTQVVEVCQELGAVLKPIYQRMKREGYGIVNGKLVKLEHHG